MGFFSSLTNKHTEGTSATSASSRDDLPDWTPAPETWYKYGKFNEAPEDEFKAAEDFCRRYPEYPPRLLPSATVEIIKNLKSIAWGLERPQSSRFIGQIYNNNTNNNKTKAGPNTIKVVTEEGCLDVCILSDLPILAGLYDIKGKQGVYFEVSIDLMDGIIAIGTACRPYPEWRLPGWNRMSAGLHLDDMRKFFEDPDGGRDYTDALSESSIKPGDIIGCGYEFGTGGLFYTYNGMRLPTAFYGLYLPRENHDVFAAIGVEGRCQFHVNFGGDLFRWKEANEWAWRIEGHVGTMAGGSGIDEELPAYKEF